MNKTSISWTMRPGTVGRTWNFIENCTRVSDGCRNCCAEAIAKRYHGSKDWTAQNAKDIVWPLPWRLDEPYRVKKPATVFTCSMSDVFHELIPDDFLRRAFEVMEDTPWHTYLILTKRPRRATDWQFWPPNVWIGTSVEDYRVKHRIDELRPCLAPIKFISFEPLIGPVGHVNLTGYSWAIVGGESGPHYRPMDHAWARDIRDRVFAAGLKFYFKQSANRWPEQQSALQEADGSLTEYKQWPEAPQWKQMELPL